MPAFQFGICLQHFLNSESSFFNYDTPTSNGKFSNSVHKTETPADSHATLIQYHASYHLDWLCTPIIKMSEKLFHTWQISLAVITWTHSFRHNSVFPRFSLEGQKNMSVMMQCNSWIVELHRNKMSSLRICICLKIVAKMLFVITLNGIGLWVDWNLDVM